MELDSILADLEALAEELKASQTMQGWKLHTLIVQLRECLVEALKLDKKNETAEWLRCSICGDRRPPSAVSVHEQCSRIGCDGLMTT